MLHVLIADDEAPARSRLRRLLAPLEESGSIGPIDEAEDGVDALEQLSAGDHDLAFLDVRMPGLDGFDVIDRLAPEVVEAALRERQHAAPDKAAVAARMADGSYTLARRLVSGDELDAQRKQAVDFVRQSYVGRASALQPIIDDVAKRGREGVKNWLGLVGTWVRDLVLARAAGNAAPLVYVDVQEITQKFVAHVPGADLEAMSALVDDAIALISGNTPSALVLTTLSFALREAMHGRPRHTLAVPLDQSA